MSLYATTSPMVMAMAHEEFRWQLVEAGDGEPDVVHFPEALLDRLVLRPLPVKEPSRLVIVDAPPLPERRSGHIVVHVMDSGINRRHAAIRVVDDTFRWLAPFHRDLERLQAKLVTQISRH